MIVGSLIIAPVVVLILRGQIKSVCKAATANAFSQGELKLTRNSDIFTHRTTETRHKIERNSS